MKPLKSFLSLFLLFAIVFSFTSTLRAIDNSDSTVNSQNNSEVQSTTMNLPTFDDNIDISKIYSIRVVGSTKYLDAAGTANASNVYQYQYMTTYSQEWKFISLGYDLYKIVNVNSGKLLTVESSANVNGTNVYLYTDNNLSGQIFKAVKNSNGSYRFQTKCSNYTKVLDINNYSHNNYANLEQYTDNNTTNQQFWLEPVAGKMFSIKNLQSGKHLMAAYSAPANGTNIEQYPYVKSNALHWSLIKADNDDYYIVNQNSGTLLSISASSSANNANVHLWEFDNTAGQKFRIKRNSDGTYSFLSKASNYTKAVQIEGNISATAANVSQYTYDGSFRQKFILEPVQKMPDETYKIEAYNSGKSLQGGTTEGANVKQYAFKNNYEQKWTIEYVGKGEHKIRNSGNRVLTVKDNSSANQASLCVNYHTGADSQLFKFRKNDDSSYSILTKSSNYIKVLDIHNYSTSDGANLEQYTDNLTTNQKFYLYKVNSPLENGIYKILSKATSGPSSGMRLIDVRNNSASLGTVIEQRDSLDSTISADTSHLFKFVYVGNGYYRIYSFSNPNYSLKCTGSGVVLGDEESTYEQTLWKIEQTNDGYTITSYSSDAYSITVPSSTANGQALTLSNKNTNDNSRNRWLFVRQQGYILSIVADPDSDSSGSISSTGDEALSLNEAEPPQAMNGQDTATTNFENEASTNSIGPLGGHGFLLFENCSSSAVTLGYIVVNPGDIVSIGTAGKAAGLVDSSESTEEHEGIFYNREAYNLYHRDYYDKRYALSVYIDETQFNKMNNDFLRNPEYNDWNLVVEGINCVYFATEVWNAVTNVRLQGYEIAGIPAPVKLADVIKSYNWHNECISMPNSEWYGYYRETGKFYYVEGHTGAHPTVPLG